MHSIHNILCVRGLRQMVRKLCIETTLFNIPKEQNLLNWALVLYHWLILRAVTRNFPMGHVFCTSRQLL